MSTALDSATPSQQVTVPFLFPAPELDGSLAAERRRAARMELACRVLNVLAAVVGLLLALPLMLLVALAVRLSSRGPVLYVQTRVGVDRRGPRAGGGDSRRRVDYGGRLFRIYKFRTMRLCEGTAQVWARPDDDRVTRVGRLLRKYRLDELPQLWNVLRGDMNVVGPRPEQPDIALELRGQIAGYQRRHQVLPGITGWAQVNQHYDRSVDDVRSKVRLDLEYIQQRSPAVDLRILLRTVPVVVFRRGAW